MVRLHELISISAERQADSAFTFYQAPAEERVSVADVYFNAGHPQWWASPTSLCSDSPQKIHPKFVMALLAALPTAQRNGRENVANWHIPEIIFGTDEWTRRSMTLNGMRMSTEYFHAGSQRVFQLIEQRLEADQTDVVHDVLVYLMSQVLEAQAAAREARCLQAESLAAYLGLDLSRTRELLLTPQLGATELAQRIREGYAGPVRRQIELLQLLENQVARLLPELDREKARESQVLEVVDRIAAQLYDYSPAS